ncbi:HAAS signaling domain-containing protein [Caulobacter sp. NIBR2454]|uniref:HAAS signaling domain-containing protein n=1 Tax=Caulobacter sp. NIBR2454 TaxID=3015996 RepID=UPI0022B6AFEB|nr:hypothetical protein [Caulobacter sp. NIBR2454]
MTVQNTDEQMIEAWLRRMTWALARMPSPQREEIVEETRVHLFERLGRGLTVDQALEGFGAPDAYARRFIEEMELAGALGSQRVSELLGAIIRRVHKSIVAFIAFIAVVCFICLAGGAAWTMGMELIDPVHTGLWSGQNSFFLGWNDDPSKFRELAGNKIYVVSAFVIAGSYVFGRLVLLWAARTLSRR